MISQTVVTSTCDLCSQYCGVLLHLEDGKVTKVEGNPESPINRGELCIKGLASLEYLYHPNRLTHPLRRAGERGEGKWKQISWDEALETIAKEWIRSRDYYGSESVAIIRGAAKGLQHDYMTRFANAFGTPNIASSSYVCYIPRQKASLLTCGFMPEPDYESSPACLLVWGAGLPKTSLGDSRRAMQTLDQGAKLIVIDPVKTEFARRANLWLQVRPGSDLALALGMINVIVEEQLFDKTFVDNWTVGFDQLRSHIQDYSPEKIAKITWVPTDTIVEAARLYATKKPACIRWGNGIDQDVNSFQTARAILILRALTGNIGIPGGDVQWSVSTLPTAANPSMSLQDNIPMDKRKRRLGVDCMIPIQFYALPQAITRAIINEDPPPIRTIYVHASNPVLTWPHAQEVVEALTKVDFLSVTDMFMTPTAALADIVLPVAGSYLEFDTIRISEYHPIAQVQQKVAQIGDCWSDYKILAELANRVGLGEYFWKSDDGFLDAVLRPAGLTYDEFRKVGIIPASKQYRNYEVNGFETSSHKIEIYSSHLKEWGFDPLPIYHEPPETPYGAPELSNEYPLVLTSFKSVSYRHSQGRQISALRGSHPDPVTLINPDTANKLGIREGEWVCIETKRGRIKQKASLTTSVDPRVVAVDYGWWFPEKGSSELYGWKESNINILTNNKPPYNCEMGSVNFRGIVCKVYKL
jgi:anaerobic selenocysteine-containing dehydrogenase